MGMDAHGIDIRSYPFQNNKLKKLFDSGRIQIMSVLDHAPLTTDIVYCNGILTYMDENTLPVVLGKFLGVKMLCAIHNTTEDIVAARKMGQELTTCNRPRLIKSNDWWIRTMNEHGFNATYDPNLRCLIAIPQHIR
ncbi:MAG: hypothetical protein IJ560_00265 [Alphaproteobacteria bacterium]|nr:hypothetical protein [Alphaproteobacteria bacterium]